MVCYAMVGEGMLRTKKRKKEEEEEERRRSVSPKHGQNPDVNDVKIVNDVIIFIIC